jgi:hypothetical protein
MKVGFGCALRYMTDEGHKEECEMRLDIIYPCLIALQTQPLVLALELSEDQEKKPIASTLQYYNYIMANCTDKNRQAC